MSDSITNIFCRNFGAAILLCLLFVFAAAQENPYEFLPIRAVVISFEGSKGDVETADEWSSLVSRSLGEKYSPIRVRDALQALYDTNRVNDARVEVTKVGTGENEAVRLRFIVRRKVFAERVEINIAPSPGSGAVTEEQILTRLTIQTAGTAVTEQSLAQSANTIQEFLRERGFYRAEVSYSQRPSETRDARAIVTFSITPNAQATIEKFDIKIPDFDTSKIAKRLRLQPNEEFSRQRLEEDLARIRAELINQNYLAPNLSPPSVIYDSDTNKISVTIEGKIGASVVVNVDEPKLSERTRRDLLPIKREGTLEYAAIVEGERRLRNRLQEDGYFFATVGSVCTITPPFADVSVPNETEIACQALGGNELTGKNVEVHYQTNLGRRLKLVDIRLEGTDEFTIDEIKPVLKSQTANILGVIPRLGYGRGYTSAEILEEDRRTIRSILRELGYRNAQVSVRQGVSLEGEDLIITFSVREGVPTIVEDVEITGNTAFTTLKLESQLPKLTGRNLSTARTRNGNDTLQKLYAAEGFYDARVSYSLIELPSAEGEPQRVKIIYKIEKEGEKNFVNRVLIAGNDRTKRQAILETIPLKEGELLRSDLIARSEQNLYGTNAFRQIETQVEPAGERGTNERLRDVIFTVEEEKPIITQFGGGYSTDGGALGFFDVRHVNLFGRLYQGGARVRLSQRQQIFQIDFLNPRFWKDTTDGAEIRYAPFSVSAQYIRDSSVTRFFRTSIDRGTNGIVQRLDADGNVIDTFGEKVKSPSINRFSFQVETNRTIRRASRSIVFLRYRYEDVRLRNLNSLVVEPILRSERVVRLSGFGATFARDTRESCNRVSTLLSRIKTGEEGDPCRYDSGEPTRGDYMTVEYNMSAKYLGGNTSFNRILVNYKRYLQVKPLYNTIFAGNVTFGAASLFSVRDRDGNGTIDEVDRTLPISERFFAGGSTTIRGFEYEQAGPRTVIMPQGVFRDRNDNLITLTPFTVPVGGNALAFVNLEARIPLTGSIQAVPFYDGGNVFRRAGEIFKPRQPTPNDIYNQNLRALWTSTAGFGLRIKTPVGGAFAVDYGYLVNPPQFIVFEPVPPNSIIRLRQHQIHFRFTQAF